MYYRQSNVAKTFIKSKLSLSTYFIKFWIWLKLVLRKRMCGLLCILA